ncbi:hypothetical protein HH110_06390 [Stenotrophomonas sp. SAM-B]|uniref:hypothetical protein n=1 Tax=Stenotrophomonas sp. SAM-B TaxID=2729141 RepID=UPI0015A109F8|nr:hypothetical protein [Stenotrophomonas sp. SAM-B]NWF32670.1 hypothetical protein [Stenotrophomonas sp. SAM-B]
MKGWLIGGLAVLVGGAAAAGGSGGSNSDSGGGGDNGGTAPGREGGQFGDLQALTASGVNAVWSQNVDTRITGKVRNDGQLQLTAGSLRVLNGGDLHNVGTIAIGEQARLVLENDADMENHGRLELSGQLLLQRDGSLDNFGGLLARNANITLNGDSDIENLGEMELRNTVLTLQDESEFDNGERRRNARLSVHGGGFILGGMSEFDNHGMVSASGALHQSALVTAVTAQVGNEREVIESFNNRGTIEMMADARVLNLIADSHASTGINRLGALISSGARGQAALHAEGLHATLLNQGTITITGDNAVAMSGGRGATLINDGTINVGVAGNINGQNMVAMQSDGSATINNRRGGVINIHADNSHAFRMGPGAGGQLINNGVVHVYGSGSSIDADETTAHANRPGSDVGWQAPRGISGYTVGTNADGSSGRMVLHQGGQLSDVAVDTGFTRGTASSQVRLTQVFSGAEGGEQNIRSASVVWRARAERDDQGIVDVVMTRNDYRELADTSLQGVAGALEAGYDNNALFHSLEVADAAEFNRALQQLSGSEMAATSMRLAADGDAFWSSLARAAPVNGHRVVAFGPGAETTYGVRGSGAGMQVAIPMAGGRQLQLISGMLGSDFSSDGGQTRNQSRFAGLGMGQSLGAFTLQHSLGNEWHQLDGQRSLRWGGTQLESHSRRSLSRTRFGSTLSRDVHAHGVHWQPRIAANAYHSREQGFEEYGAHAFGLSVGAGTRSGVQLELGSMMNARLGANWQLRGDIALLGSVVSNASTRLARLHGAGNQAFELASAMPRGMDYRLMLGADYRRARLTIGTALMAQRQFAVTDTQAQLHLGYAY